jgi:hypothetical protein
MKKIVLPFVALGLLVTPAFMGASVIGSSVQAEEIRIGVPGVRVEDRDNDRDHRRWRRDHDRDDVVVIKKRHRDYDRDND